jgi:hypothetical protein
MPHKQAQTPPAQPLALQQSITLTDVACTRVKHAARGSAKAPGHPDAASTTMSLRAMWHEAAKAASFQNSQPCAGLQLLCARGGRDARDS